MFPERVTLRGCTSYRKQKAFAAMTRFLTEFYERAGNDMETLLADVTIEKDGMTLDPAAWEDGMRSVRAVKGK